MFGFAQKFRFAFWISYFITCVAFLKIIEFTGLYFGHCTTFASTLLSIKDGYSSLLPLVSKGTVYSTAIMFV